jgi:uncharacterized protein YlxW (UPF0749 family)
LKQGDITEGYKKWNFTNKEREKLVKLDKELVRLRKKQATKIRQVKKLDEELAKLNRAESECWSKARTMQTKLEKRCKHNGGTFTRQIYRDFGEDVIRTLCSQCGHEISSRRKDE